MKTKQVITGLAATIMAVMIFQPTAHAGMVKITNNFDKAVMVGTYSGTSQNKVSVYPNESRTDASFVAKSITRILVVNVGDGADPNKARLKEYVVSSPSIVKDYILVIDKAGVVTVTEKDIMPK